MTSVREACKNDRCIFPHAHSSLVTHTITHHASRKQVSHAQRHYTGLHRLRRDGRGHDPRHLAQRLIAPEAITASDPLPIDCRHCTVAMTFTPRPITRLRHTPAKSSFSASNRKRSPRFCRTSEPAGCGQPGGQYRCRHPINVIRRGLGIEKIIRAMPNTPGQVGHGMTVWTATDAVDDLGRHRRRPSWARWARSLCRRRRATWTWQRPSAAPGQAYVFLFMEAYDRRRRAHGLQPPGGTGAGVSDHRGIGGHARASGIHPTELRNQVTSPGGTTAEALYQLEKGGLRTVISKAIWAAYQRSKA